MQVVAILNFLNVFTKLLAERSTSHDGTIKLLQFGTKAIELGAEGVALLEQATAKVQTMVDENRGLTEEEDAALDASIQAKLDAIAATKIDA